MNMATYTWRGRIRRALRKMREFKPVLAPTPDRSTQRRDSHWPRAWVGR